MKKPLAVAILLSTLLALPAAAQMLSCYEGTLRNASGNALTGQTVAVLSGTTSTVTTTTHPGSPLATIYADPYGNVQIPQSGASLSGTVSTSAASPLVLAAAEVNSA